MLQAVTPTVSLSNEQIAAIDLVQNQVEESYRQRKPLLIAISGAAGTGKSTCMRELEKRLLDAGLMVQICGMTNKAAHILRRKGIVNAITFHQAAMRPILRAPYNKLGSFLDQAGNVLEDDVEYPDTLIEEFGIDSLKSSLYTTEHQGIYAAFRQLGIKDIFKYIDGWAPAGPQEGVLIIDEASMLGEDDLRTAQEVFARIILVGDENQLPPVKDSPVFWNIRNKVTLQQIHRQEEGSSVLDLATAIRLGKHIDVSAHGGQSMIDLTLCQAGMPVIVWRNKTRIELTNTIRKKLGYENQPPQIGEWLICRNTSDRQSKSKGLINNTLWKVIAAHNFSCTLENEDGEELQGITVHMEELDAGNGIPFRFAYAVSGHSSQGSQYETVQVHYGEVKAFFQFNKIDARKFLYTAVTRAEKRVIFVSNKVA